MAHNPFRTDNVPSPNLSTFGGKIFGDSFSENRGQSVTDLVPHTEIDTSKLGTTNISDGIEFNDFEEYIKSFILGRLGHPVIRVELTPFQLKSSIDESISKFEFHAPMWTMQMAAFDASAGINIYELPQYMLNNLEYVVYKKTLLTIQQQAGTLEFDFFIKYFQDNFLFQNFGVGDFYLLQQHLEQLRKILGQEGGFNVLNNKYLQIYPAPVITPQGVVIVYRALDSNTIHPAYRNWIQRYALAVAKGILGEIRGKYATLPGPGGGSMLNGSDLKQESMSEKAALEEELRNELEEPPAFTVF